MLDTKTFSPVTKIYFPVNPTFPIERVYEKYELILFRQWSQDTQDW